jgi:hypothetical protein
MTPPTRYALVPVAMTAPMHNALLDKVATDHGFDNWTFHPDAGWDAALAASPNGGAVTAADLERAAKAAWENLGGAVWDDLGPRGKSQRISDQRAALTALGLAVADAGEEAGNG